jgi:hypothetical protein
MSKKGGINMPGRNGMGPNNLGPMTGRGMGPCGQGRARNARFNRGYGRGYGYNIYQPTKEDLAQEKEDLLRRVEEIEDLLK